MKEIRIADVARLAGVSTATVSRVLSDPDKVRQKTHDLVMEKRSDSNISVTIISVTI